MRRLALFDIDGTILSSNGVAARAFRAALEDVFGTCGPGDAYSFAGKTDPRIARDLLRLGGIADELVADGLDDVWRLYVRRLEKEIAAAARITVFPGVRHLLGRLSENSDVVLGLLTGNLREGARLKLQAAGLRFEDFVVGAFGSDHADRSELPAIAIRRAEALTGHRFGGKSVVIIGDTPSDISCGEHLGVKTIAVATGSYDLAELAAHRPDHLFATLDDTDAVIRAILE